MTRRPVSTPVRALAALGYVFPIAAVLLALPAYRQVRLIRVHGLASLILAGSALLAVLAMGSLRPGNLEIALFVGIMLSLALLAYFVLAVWGAICAYQGRNPAIPGVMRLAERLEKLLAPAREV